MVIAELLLSILDFLFTAPPVSIFATFISVNRICTYFELKIMWSLTSAFSLLVYIFFAKHRRDRADILSYPSAILPLVPTECDVCWPQLTHYVEFREFCNT